MKVIEVRGISKKYYLGQTISLKNTLMSLMNVIKSLFNFNCLKKSSIQSDQTEFWALKNVSFELNQGEILGIIGTNGSGKSTLLKILSRVTSPTNGEATIRGRVSSLLEVGTGFNPELSGRENIYLNGSLLGLTRKEIDSKFDEIVKFAGVEKFIDTPIKRYSSGMTVRLGFSVAAHLEAQIMVIDEVLAVGDADFQRKSLARLNEIRNSGKSIIFVSHSMELVAKLCERVLWLNLGEVKQIGTPSEVIQNYLKYHENQRGQIKRLKSSDGDGSFPFIAELKMLDKNLNIIESVEVGEKVIFNGFVSGLPIDVESVLSFYIWIENQNGLVVAELNSDWKSEKKIGRGLTEFNIVLPRLVLAQGLYTVNSELKVNYQRTDYSLQIFNFFVLASDFYNSGVLPTTRGSLYLDFDIDIEAVSQKENKE